MTTKRPPTISREEQHRKQAIEGVRRGLEAARKGRTASIDDAFAEIRRRVRLTQDARKASARRAAKRKRKRG